MSLSGCVRLLGRQSSRCVPSRITGSLKTQHKYMVPSVCSHRHYTSGEQSNILVTMDDKTGVATMKLNRPPVNGLNLELLTEFDIALEKLHNERACRGLILTSTSPSVFSGGIDILEMYQPKPERLAEFWRALQDVWMKLYGSRLSTVAAINGHSPAGGCLLAISCDHRVMAQGKFTIGLNETLLGIVAPFWFQETMVNTIGHRETERALQLGLLYSGEDALKIGLVDELVPQDQVTEAANTQLNTWLKIPDFARQLTKEQLRRPTIQRLASRQDEDIENFVKFISKDAIQRALGGYLEMLKKKQDAKKQK